MKKYLIQFFYLLDKQARRQLPFLILYFIVSSLLDVFGIGLVGIFLAMMTNPNYLAEKFANKNLVFSSNGNNQTLIIIGISIVIAFIIKSFLVLTLQKKVIHFCQAFSVRLKTRLMTSYQYAPYTYHLQKNSDYLISRIQVNIDSYIGNVVLALLNILSNLLMTILIVLLLLLVHPVAILALITIFFLFGMSYDFLVKKKLSDVGKILAITTGETSRSIRHGLYGLIESRVLGREKYFIEKLTHYSRIHADAYSILMTRQLVPRYLIEATLMVFIIAVCIIGLSKGSNPSNVVAIVGIFAAAGARLLPTTTQIMSGLHQVRGYFHHMGLVYDEFKEVEERLSHCLQQDLVSITKEKLPYCQINLQNVTFQYPQATFAALKGINLSISKGQSIGLIGTSGAGKSTLVNLILGFLEPQKGFLLVDGKPVRNSRAWLNNFAYIPQSIFLLDDSLRHNIAFGMDDGVIDQDRLLHAIHMARLTEVVENLPRGMDTIIGENGVRLSGGQRQRVALARAFYHERDIIIMDEATSSLDNETEKEIINAIKQFKGNKTLIVIAHRLTTVEHCDVLYRLKNGVIVCSGTFKEVVNFTEA